MNFKKINHICLHSSDYESTKDFYTNILGFSIFSESYDETTSKRTLRLELNDSYIEIVSHDCTNDMIDNIDPSYLSHLAIEVSNIESAMDELKGKNVTVQNLREDPKTKKKYTFFKGPDNIWIEMFQKSIIDICLENQYI